MHIRKKNGLCFRKTSTEVYSWASNLQQTSIGSGNSLASKKRRAQSMMAWFSDANKRHSASKSEQPHFIIDEDLHQRCGEIIVS